MPNWDKIRKEWETTKITLVALAEKHGIKLGTLKSRKSRENWSRGATKKDATISKRMQPKKEEKEPIVESDNLTDKQRLFCIYYIKYFNATKAYQKAYECAYTTAMVEGHRHLRNPKINAEIDRIKAEQTNELKLDVRDLLQKYIDIAFADITDFVDFGQKDAPEVNAITGEPMLDENGDQVMYQYSHVNLKNADEVDGTIITEVKKGKDGVSVKLADRMKALEALEKYLGFMSEEQKARIAVLKAKVPNKDTTDMNKQIVALADLINNPAPDRVIDDD